MPNSKLIFWIVKFAAAVDHDQRKARALPRLGRKVIPLWECEMKGGPPRV